MEIKFKDLSIEELKNGYIISSNTKEYICIFCCEKFEDGVIYHSKGRMVTAHKAILDHIEIEHNGVFSSLVDFDKSINGLSDIQKRLLTHMYKKSDNKVICEDMGISPATVRSHKFNIQKLKKEAKILLALLEEIENGELVVEKNLISEKEKTYLIEEEEKSEIFFKGNTLHPFFKKYINQF